MIKKDKIRVSAVSYTNTLPFLYGIEHSDVRHKIELSVDYPSECARKLIEGEVDLGIIPIAGLTELDEAYIITDYCIGTEGEVDSVFLFSDKPVEEISTLRLDSQSRTSNGLARILLQKYWEKDVRIVDNTEEADAYVLIGDRTFEIKDKQKYAYDLGYYWKEYTGLPFAFAVWVSNKELSSAFIESFNAALAYGVENTNEVVKKLNPLQNGFDFHTYLTQNLNYHLDEQKRKAMELYLSLRSELIE